MKGLTGGGGAYDRLFVSERADCRPRQPEHRRSGLTKLHVFLPGWSPAATAERGGGPRPSSPPSLLKPPQSSRRMTEHTPSAVYTPQRNIHPASDDL